MNKKITVNVPSEMVSFFMILMHHMGLVVDKKLKPLEEEEEGRTSENETEKANVSLETSKETHADFNNSNGIGNFESEEVNPKLTKETESDYKVPSYTAEPSDPLFEWKVAIMKQQKKARENRDKMDN